MQLVTISALGTQSLRLPTRELHARGKEGGRKGGSRGKGRLQENTSPGGRAHLVIARTQALPQMLVLKLQRRRKSFQHVPPPPHTHTHTHFHKGELRSS